MENKKRYHIIIASDETDAIKRFSISRKGLRIIFTSVIFLLFFIVISGVVFVHNFIKFKVRFMPVSKKYEVVKKQNLQLEKENEKLYARLRKTEFNLLYWEKNTKGKLLSLSKQIKHIARFYKKDVAIGGVEHINDVRKELNKKLIDGANELIFDKIGSNFIDEIGNYEWLLAREERAIIKYFIFSRGISFSWPVKSVRITSYYGERWDPMNGRIGFHRGIDFGGTIGVPVFAAASGKVLWSGRVKEYGNLVIINHSYAVSSRYAHLNNFVVKSGDYVKKGELIGFIGATGRTTGPHLHFEIRINGETVNPLKILR